MTQITTMPRVRSEILVALGTTMIAAQLRANLDRRNCLSLGTCLDAGIVCPGTLLQAMADDIMLEYGGAVTDIAVLGYTDQVIAVGFLARTVRGLAAAPRPGDPIALLWPWGYPAAATDLMRNLKVGIASMLAEDWPRAADQFCRASHSSAAVAQQERVLVRRSLAANIELAVNYSHGGIT